MHELSIAQNILSILRQEIPSTNLSKIKSVKLKLGILSNIYPPALEEGWQVVSQNSGLPDCRLDIEQIPMTINCLDCGHDFSTNEFAFTCFACGSTNIEVKKGEEITLSEIEL